MDATSSDQLTKIYAGSGYRKKEKYAAKKSPCSSPNTSKNEQNQSFKSNHFAPTSFSFF